MFRLPQSASLLTAGVRVGVTVAVHRVTGRVGSLRAEGAGLPGAAGADGGRPGRFPGARHPPALLPLVTLGVLGDVRKILKTNKMKCLELIVSCCSTHHLKNVVLFGHHHHEQRVPGLLDHLDHLGVGAARHALPVDTDYPVPDVEPGLHGGSLVLH